MTAAFVMIVAIAGSVTAGLSLVAPAPTARAQSAGCAAPSGTLSIAICGREFVNQAGVKVTLRGANTEGTQYDCAQSGAGFYDDPTVTPSNYPSSTTDASTEITAMKAWGINVVRINLNEECWLGINGVPSTTSQTSNNGDAYPIPSGDAYDTHVNAYMYEMGQYVAALNDAGIYAEIDLHLNAPGSELISDNGSGDAQNPLPESNSDNFWKSVASYFSENHAVIFGVFNEPFPPSANANGDTTTGWNCVLNGCTVPDYTNESADQYGSQTPTTTYSGEGMKQMIDDIRDYDTTAPLLVGGPDFAGDMDQWLATYYPNGVSIDPSNELAASVHIYFPAGNSPCSNTMNIAGACPGQADSVVAVANTTPVVVDETGDFTCSSNQSSESSDLRAMYESVDFLDHLGLDIGYVGWAWTTAGCDPNMITSWTTGAPSGMGTAEYCELLDIGLAPVNNSLFSPQGTCSLPPLT